LPRVWRRNPRLILADEPVAILDILNGTLIVAMVMVVDLISARMRRAVI
jgi:ABC-type phosphate/phosphonate transport system ATPase subunit